MPIDIKRTHYKTNGQGRSLQDIACYAKSGMMSYSLGTPPIGLTNSPPDCLLLAYAGPAFESLPAQNKLGYMPPWGYSIHWKACFASFWDSPHGLNKQSTGLFVTSAGPAFESPSGVKN